MYVPPLLRPPEYTHPLSYRQAASNRPKEPLPVDDKEGHFIVRVGDTLMKRCQSSSFRSSHRVLTLLLSDEILRSLGQGTFGKVVCARDNETGRDVAVKIMYVLLHTVIVLD